MSYLFFGVGFVIFSIYLAFLIWNIIYNGKKGFHYLNTQNNFYAKILDQNDGIQTVLLTKNIS